ncbi:MAG: sulfotransferase, partial [Candidatus Halalkalibacterium sp. M3_1C_030]
YSSKKLWNTLLDNLALQKLSEREMEEEIIRVYKKLMSRYLDQREEIPRNQLIEVRFQDFVRNPVAELSKIYHSLNITGFKSKEAIFRQFLENKATGKSSSYEYENRIITRLNKEWKFAFDEWNYEMVDRD